MPGTVCGDALFRNDARGVLEFMDSTGAAAGTGTPSVVGDLWLTLNHAATTYAPLTGLTASASSGRDTILGAHTLTVDAAQKTLALDDGPAVSFDAASTDLALTNQAGDAVHVDAHAWVDFNGAVQVTGSGTASLDDGQTTIDLGDFSNGNLHVLDSAGRALFVDTRNIRRTGVEPVHAAGSYDLFGALINLRDLLLNQRNLRPEQQASLLNQSVEHFRQIAEGMARAVAGIGARAQAVDSVKTRLDEARAGSTADADALESADAVQMATELAQAQVLYELTLNTAGRIMKLSLLDYL
jgi:flagellin-like hook-associated protein FlgL